MQALFICGLGHSGTTLAANMFAAHPDVHVPLRETKAFVRKNRLKGMWNYHVRLRLERLSSSKSYLVEKTPGHVHCLPLIRKIVGRPRFLLMVRDGRDVAASRRKRKGSFSEGLTSWVKVNSLVASEMASDDVHVLRYEDLVTSPEHCLRRVCEFAGIPFSASMLEFHTQERLWFGERSVKKGDGSGGAEQRALRNWQVNQPLFDGRGGWRQVLTDAEAAEFLKPPASILMERFGYAP